jgi:hypothetical protein
MDCNSTENLDWTLSEYGKNAAEGRVWSGPNSGDHGTVEAVASMSFILSRSSKKPNRAFRIYKVLR